LLYYFFHGNELQVLKRKTEDLIVMVQIGIGKHKWSDADVIAIDKQIVMKGG
jgi:hypothetical protein